MIKADLVYMLVGAYELGLKQGKNQAKSEMARSEEWIRFKDDTLKDYEELVTL